MQLASHSRTLTTQASIRSCLFKCDQWTRRGFTSGQVLSHLVIWAHPKCHTGSNHPGTTATKLHRITAFNSFNRRATFFGTLRLVARKTPPQSSAKQTNSFRVLTRIMMQWLLIYIKSYRLRSTLTSGKARRIRAASRTIEGTLIWIRALYRIKSRSHGISLWRKCRIR